MKAWHNNNDTLTIDMGDENPTVSFVCPWCFAVNIRTAFSGGWKRGACFRCSKQFKYNAHGESTPIGASSVYSSWVVKKL